METGQRRVGPATLRIRQTVAIPQHMRASVREVAALEVPAAEQRKGYATTLMHKVCREADAAGMVLLLWPQPYGDNVSMSRDELADWYGREFGFQAIQPEPLLMARQPGATPRFLELKPGARAAFTAVKEGTH